ncbi:c-type cytochrome [Paradesulfitobacterium aromaticivorans]
MRIKHVFFLLFILVFVSACSPTPQMPPQAQQPQAPSQTPEGALPPSGTLSQIPSQGVIPNQGYPSNQVGSGIMNGTQGPYNRAPSKTEFKSNGERIYFTGQDNSGTYIRANSIGMPMSSMTSGCYGCHGPNGKGGTIPFMMGTIDVPDIRYKTLSGKDPDMEHPPYTEETLKRAITQGVDPGAHPLDPPMPKWQMSTQDLNDLISYLKFLP